MHYKIYIPGVDTPNDSHLVDAGCGDLFRDCGADWEQVSNGPDEGRGMVCTHRSGRRECDPPDGIPKDFKWSPSAKNGDHEKGAYWVGIHPEHTPGPGDLQRSGQLPGVPVELADSRKWSIPIAKGIPCTIGIDEDTGDPVHRIEDQHKRFCERAFRHASLLAEREEKLHGLGKIFLGTRLTDDEMRQLYTLNTAKWAGISTLNEMDQQLSVAVLFDDCLSHAVDALAINYRLNTFLVLHLGLLAVSPNENHLRDICLAAIEAPTLIEDLKKNKVDLYVSLLDG